jgi:hypothetical protein
MRTRLPDRRQNETRQLDGLSVTVGFDAHGGVREVFCDGLRGDMQALADDVCVLISLLLQEGVPPAAMLKSMGTVPDLQHGEFEEKPASIVGVILEAL